MEDGRCEFVSILAGILHKNFMGSLEVSDVDMRDWTQPKGEDVPVFLHIVVFFQTSSLKLPF